jgi:hypothetical protein
MLDKLIALLQEKGSVLFTVKVIPKAKKTEVLGLMSDGTVKIKLKAVPEDGKANHELITFLSKELNIAPSHITIMSGWTSHRKLLHIIV